MNKNLQLLAVLAIMGVTASLIFFCAADDVLSWLMALILIGCVKEW